MKFEEGDLYVVKINTCYFFKPELPQRINIRKLKLGFISKFLKFPHLIRITKLDVEKRELFFEFQFTKKPEDKLRKICFHKVTDLYDMFIPPCNSLMDLVKTTPIEFYWCKMNGECLSSEKRQFQKAYGACCIESIRVYDDFLIYNEKLANYIHS